MKVVILAGGMGTRISEYTKTIPKPMIKINKKPLLVHILEYYYKYGFNDFYIAAGYKGNVIKRYFKKKHPKFKISIIDTGKKTMTGGRLKRLKKIIGNERFMMTYGDGVCDLNLRSLINFHKKQKKLVTLTAVRPPARFGALKLKGSKVAYFKEKSKLDEGWINGGFFVMEPKFIDYIKNDKTYLEREPLEKVCKINQLNAFKHLGFWYCMDTKRDKDNLENILRNRKK
mgnify:FL=1|tara:strand:- start:205 stop:891 length:687 start_codon:yes stop_codon:yes gene_type:complete